MNQKERDNHSKNMNPNNEQYYKCRGIESGGLIETSYSMNQWELDNNSMNFNPNNAQYYKSRGIEIPDTCKNSGYSMNQAELDNHAKNMNPNNDQFYKSKGIERATNDMALPVWGPCPREVRDRTTHLISHNKSRGLEVQHGSASGVRQLELGNQSRNLNHQKKSRGGEIPDNSNTSEPEEESWLEVFTNTIHFANNMFELFSTKK